MRAKTILALESWKEEAKRLRKESADDQQSFTLREFAEEADASEKNAYRRIQKLMRAKKLVKSKKRVDGRLVSSYRMV